MAKQVSKSNTASTTRNYQKTTNKNTSVQNNSSWNNQTSTSSQNSVSYKDLSNLSPETLALKDKVMNYSTTPSQAVQNAYGNKQAAENAYANYGSFSYKNNDSLEEVFNKILNRPSFNYDFNADALYQSYRDQYAQRGKQAAENAAAAASTLTGGYGNSYAASAAAQANQQYMTELNDKIPELYRLAQERYNSETNNLNNAYNLLNADKQFDYGMYQDAYNRLQADRNYAAEQYNNERNYDMTEKQNEYDRAFNMLNYLTGLEARDVTSSTGKDVTKSKSGSKATSTEKNSQTSSSVTNDNQSTTTTSTSTGSSGSKSSSKSVSSNSKDVSDIQKGFETRFNRAYKEDGSIDNAIASAAFDYLQNAFEQGLITDKEWEKIKNKVAGDYIPK